MYNNATLCVGKPSFWVVKVTKYYSFVVGGVTHVF
jgi:hypothetical protein